MIIRRHYFTQAKSRQFSKQANQDMSEEKPEPVIKEFTQEELKFQNYECVGACVVGSETYKESLEKGCLLNWDARPNIVTNWELKP